MAVGPITQGLFPADILPGMQEFFGLDYKNYEPIFSKIFDVRKDDEQFVQQVIASPFSVAAIKNEGSAFKGDTAKQGYTNFKKQLVYGLTFSLTMEAIIFGHALNKAEELSKAARKSLEITREKIAHGVLNNAQTAFASGIHKSPDGVALASAAHPLTGGGLGSNVPAVNAALSEAMLEQAWIDTSLQVDERGKLISIMLKDLVVPVQLKMEADRILKNVDRPHTADRDINALVKNSIIKDVIASPYLTSSTQFFLTTDIDRGLQVRQKLEPTLQSEMDPNLLTKDAVFIAYMIMSAFYSDWRGVYVVAGA